MKKAIFVQKYSRRRFCSQTPLAVLAMVLLSSSGCSTFKSHKKNKENDAEFEEDEEEDESKEENVFDSERKKQNEMSDFVAQNGRKSKSKKSSVRPGDDFLLSDKAKEIYANTER